MSQITLKTLCTALAFTATVIQGGEEKGSAERTRRFAELIEEFCCNEHGSALTVTDTVTVDQVIEKFKTALRNEGDAMLPPEREWLVALYDRLTHKQAQRKYAD